MFFSKNPLKNLVGLGVISLIGFRLAHLVNAAGSLPLFPTVLVIPIALIVALLIAVRRSSTTRR